MIKLMAKVNISMLKVQLTKVVGMKISKRVMEKKSGQMVLFTTDSISVAKSMAKEYFNGQTVLSMTETGKTTKCMASAHLSGLMEEFTKESI